MLYTVVPMELLTYPSQISETEFKRIDGGLLEMRRENGQYRIVRLISSDPKMYLNGQYSPGSIYQAGGAPHCPQGKM